MASIIRVDNSMRIFINISFPLQDAFIDFVTYTSLRLPERIIKTNVKKYKK